MYTEILIKVDLIKILVIFGPQHIFCSKMVVVTLHKIIAINFIVEFN